MIKMLNRNSLRKNQTGASFWTIAIVVSMVALFLLTGLKLAPAYVDNNVIMNAIANLDGKEGLENLTINEIRIAVRKTLVTNNIRDFDAENIQQVKIDNIDYIEVNYESRVPLFYNIEAVVIFENRVRK